MIDGFTNFFSKFANIFGNIIGQVRILVALPDLLDLINIRCIRRQPFHLNAAELWAQTVKYNPRYRRFDEIVIAEIADNRSRRSQL